VVDGVCRASPGDVSSGVLSLFLSGFAFLAASEVVRHRQSVLDFFGFSRSDGDFSGSRNDLSGR